MKTKVVEGKFKGTFAVWEVDENDEPKAGYPIVSMGKKKLKAILDNLEEIKEFMNMKDD